MLVNHGNSSDLAVVEQSKKCYVCGVNKAFSKFAQKRKKWDTQCKECRNKKFRERYKRIRKAKRKYRSIPIQKVVDVCFRGDDINGSALAAVRQKTIEAIITDIVLEVFTEKYSYEQS